MHRFFIEKDDFFLDHCIISDKNDINHIKKSLRIVENEVIEVSIKNSKKEYCGNVKFSLSDNILVENLVESNIKRESPIMITLFQGLAKADKFEYIIQKSVELGVSNIVPVEMERSIVKIDKKKDLDKKIDRWNKISYEASKQSKRTIIPSISEPIKFSDMLDLFKNYDLVLFLYEKEENVKLKNIFSNNNFAKNVCIIVGPEGGFSENESEKIIGKGGTSVSLGRRILRTETAGITCISIVQYELGDLG